jgi:hypothetical protein
MIPNNRGALLPSVGQSDSARHAHGNGNARTLKMRKMNPAAYWLAHAEAEVRQAQKALDNLDSLNLPAQWGELDVARLRVELIAAHDDHANKAAHWRRQRGRPQAA